MSKSQSPARLSSCFLMVPDRENTRQGQSVAVSMRARVWYLISLTRCVTMSASAPQTEAARKAAARKAKILARGNSGLNQLAQTARGDEASTLYGQEGESRYQSFQ